MLSDLGFKIEYKLPPKTKQTKTKQNKQTKKLFIHLSVRRVMFSPASKRVFPKAPVEVPHEHQKHPVSQLLTSVTSQ